MAENSDNLGMGDGVEYTGDLQPDFAEVERTESESNGDKLTLGADEGDLMSDLEPQPEEDAFWFPGCKPSEMPYEWGTQSNVEGIILIFRGDIKSIEGIRHFIEENVSDIKQDVPEGKNERCIPDEKCKVEISGDEIRLRIPQGRFEVDEVKRRVKVRLPKRVVKVVETADGRTEIKDSPYFLVNGHSVWAYNARIFWTNSR
ncbi:hypothetical protein IPG41_06895 [Candidatus Peregrinibacteria bacterium]|nr:MAG: hypothetical protein IPG41_06895 [Candidatus Peregrinibacteria bacterium]